MLLIDLTSLLLEKLLYMFYWGGIYMRRRVPNEHLHPYLYKPSYTVWIKKIFLALQAHDTAELMR